MATEIRIGAKVAGRGHPCLVIAEAGVNHNGDLELARRLVDAAVDAGADVVKFQTFKTEAVVGRFSPKAEYQLTSTDPTESQFEMAKKLELGDEAFRELRDRAHARGIVFMSSPFDEPSVELLARLDVPAFKIGSGEVTNAVLLRAIAKTGKPAILSTGMSEPDEVAEALADLRSHGPRELALLHCLSTYPAPTDETNLRAMHALEQRFQVPVGYSDHTLGNEVSLAAVAIGATIIEKHLTLDCSMEGPDHRASLDPPAFKELVRAIRSVEAALGDGVKRPMPSELDVRRVARRSLVASRPLAAGTVLTIDDLAVKRPGTGIPSKHRELLVGRTLGRALQLDEVLTWEDVGGR